jgi:hypothetical protein
METMMQSTTPKFSFVGKPLEYAGKVWDPEKYPWQTVAKLVILIKTASYLPESHTGNIICDWIRGMN